MLLEVMFSDFNDEIYPLLCFESAYERAGASVRKGYFRLNQSSERQHFKFTRRGWLKKSVSLIVGKKKILSEEGNILNRKGVVVGNFKLERLFLRYWRMHFRLLGKSSSLVGYMVEKTNVKNALIARFYTKDCQMFVYVNKGDAFLTPHRMGDNEAQATNNNHISEIDLAIMICYCSLANSCT